MENNEHVQDELKRLRRKMRVTCFFFHPFRNNPRNRERYYFTLIRLVGYDRWCNVDECIRVNWESSRLSFDRLFGMVREFCDAPDKYAMAFTVDVGEKKKAQEECAEMNALCKEMKQTLGKINELEREFTGIAKRQSAQLDKTSKLLTVEADLRKCCKELKDTLSQSEDDTNSL